MKTVRVTTDALVLEARRLAHRFQAIRLDAMLAKGWTIESVQRSPNGHKTTVITLRNDAGSFGYIAPNGFWMPRLKGRKSVSWNWHEMALLAEATIPAPGVVVFA